MLVTALLAIVLFSLMIFPHELGHFLAAKSIDVKVNEFSFGMGPALLKKQKGETLYSIRLFPVGGYCAMEGEDEDENNAGSRAFVNKKPWQKIYVLVAGAFMNIMVSLIVMTIMAMASGMLTTTLDTVTPGSPADLAGLKSGDVIVEMNDVSIKNWSDISANMTKDGSSVTVVYNRDGEEYSADITPVQEEGRYIIGITSKISRSPFRALKYGALETLEFSKIIYKSLKMLVSGDAGITDMSGPVGIISVVHETTTYGLSFFFYLLSLISVNLAVINMLPLPALDGGRILFVVLRWIFGDRISDHAEGIVHFVGFALLMALALVVTWSDIVKLFA